MYELKLDSSEKRALAIFSVILGVLLILLVFTVTVLMFLSITTWTAQNNLPFICHFGVASLDLPLDDTENL